ncbi:flagellar basal-body MS-ring/collar protein FliF [Jannaschia sp. LMIT008]|uniref:flagellar basal-body MS-ring/collar protein FliF n=1 Tax=Jannaschia maritima TaxID=3032585 RepID=UPI0028113DC7|nr:flagellar basal-body MS-ring/collar protein FliF [Jannaschia sp. LMIT008]
MQTIVEYWNRGDYLRLAILAGAVAGTFAAILLLGRMAAAPTLELLFARLDPAVAGRIVTELETRGVSYDVRGDSIYVDGGQRDRLRLDLAGEGLPGADGAGYEILDGLSGFGTTSQMFDAAYWRAREGELARTILAGRGVEAARVHIAAPGRSPFSRDEGATASATLRMKTGAVPADLAEAVQSLVAGAVRGLDPDSVSVVDSRTGRVVSRDAGTRDGAARGERLAEMRAAVDRLLTARVGADRFVAEISLETTTDIEQLRERTLDPDSRVIISVDTEESTSSDVGAAGQGVTVASNLPDGDAGGGSESRSNASGSRERVNYEVSERERQVTRGAGAVERITVAVMVDGVTAPDSAGAEAWQPRPQEELDAIRDLVQSAVGFREGRGDVVTVRSLQFQDNAVAIEGGATAPWLTGAQMVRLATVAAILMGLVALMAFVVRPLLDRRGASAPAGSDASGALPAPGAAGGIGAGAAPALAAPPERDANGLPILPDLPDLDDGGLPSLDDLPALGGGGSGPASGGAEEDPVERLRSLIAERRDETVEVLRGWIEEDAPAEETT